jgi:hypothetical protein
MGKRLISRFPDNLTGKERTKNLNAQLEIHPFALYPFKKYHNASTGVRHDREKNTTHAHRGFTPAAVAPPNAITSEEGIHHYHFMLKIGSWGQAQSPS